MCQLVIWGRAWSCRPKKKRKSLRVPMLFFSFATVFFLFSPWRESFQLEILQESWELPCHPIRPRGPRRNHRSRHPCIRPCTCGGWGRWYVHLGEHRPSTWWAGWYWNSNTERVHQKSSWRRWHACLREKSRPSFVFFCLDVYVKVEKRAFSVVSFLFYEIAFLSPLRRIPKSKRRRKNERISPINCFVLWNKQSCNHGKQPYVRFDWLRANCPCWCSLNLSFGVDPHGQLVWFQCTY